MKTVLIMGAHGGIGGALADRLRKRDIPLALTARDAASVAGAIRCDVLVTAEADNSIENAVAQCGDALGGLVYAIGSIDLKPLKSVTGALMQQAYDLNVIGAMRAIKAAAPALKNGQGSVVLFSSIAVQQGFAQHTIISAAKGAVEGMARALAAELAPHVRVNVIAPSLSDTPLAKSITSNETMTKAIADLHPLPRLGMADDSAAAAEWLLCDAPWVTGQVIHIDGGRSALRVKG
jgi:NAD(P)-dependent dehydrogenase (short-subunit alcohol dehydrogenase family)